MDCAFDDHIRRVRSRQRRPAVFCVRRRVDDTCRSFGDTITICRRSRQRSVVCVVATRSEPHLPTGMAFRRIGRQLESCSGPRRLPLRDHWSRQRQRIRGEDAKHGGSRIHRLEQHLQWLDRNRNRRTTRTCWIQQRYPHVADNRRQRHPGRKPDLPRRDRDVPSDRRRHQRRRQLRDLKSGSRALRDEREDWRGLRLRTVGLRDDRGI